VVEDTRGLPVVDGGGGQQRNLITYRQYIFASLAFLILPSLFGGEALPLAAIPSIIGGQILFKAIVTVVSMPMIYLVKEQPVRLVVAPAD
jgi:hypothetical protein